MNGRLPVAAAVVFAVLYGGALFMVPPLPGIDKPGGAVVSHLSDHAGAMGFGVPARTGVVVETPRQS